jgi:hypothetical protein
MNALVDAPALDPVDPQSAEAQRLTAEEWAGFAGATDDSDFPISTELFTTRPPCRHWGINE